MKRASTGRQESLRFKTGQHGFTNFSFMFAAAGRQESVWVNQELNAGPHGLKQVKTVYYEVCISGMQSHTAGFEPGPYGIKTASTQFHPYRPASGVHAS
jgi:hypothetical protein